jgi:hypothetical protein
MTPMLFEVVPQGLWVLVPPNADKSLWQHPAAIAPIVPALDKDNRASHN